MYVLICFKISHLFFRHHFAQHCPVCKAQEMKANDSIESAPEEADGENGFNLGITVLVIIVSLLLIFSSCIFFGIKYLLLTRNVGDRFRKCCRQIDNDETVNDIGTLSQTRENAEDPTNNHLTKINVQEIHSTLTKRGLTIDLGILAEILTKIVNDLKTSVRSFLLEENQPTQSRHRNNINESKALMQLSRRSFMRKLEELNVVAEPSVLEEIYQIICNSLQPLTEHQISEIYLEVHSSRSNIRDSRLRDLALWQQENYFRRTELTQMSDTSELGRQPPGVSWHDGSQSVPSVPPPLYSDVVGNT